MVASRAQARAAKEVECLNPLHCGAVVASDGAPPSPEGGRASFNPLHCGAVVASKEGAGNGRRRGGVSIPFIAGQWSLRPGMTTGRRRGASFQSPSLRGSGRFTEVGGDVKFLGRRQSQSPSLRGSGRFRMTRISGESDYPVSIPFIAGQWSLQGRRKARRAPWRRVSIPFIAGQWSLPPRRMAEGQRRKKSQSPSLRGSGRFPKTMRAA